MSALVAESRARCGLPAKITEPAALRLLAGLFEADRKTLDPPRSPHVAVAERRERQREQ